jgi:CO/xanthine dehydrogenase Mo-binding subunit
VQRIHYLGFVRRSQRPNVSRLTRSQEIDTQLLTLPSFPDNYRFHSTRFFTNKPPCGPKRGHGSVQRRFAYEVLLDEVACKLGIDPIELRRKNIVSPGSKTLNGIRVTSNGVHIHAIQILHDILHFA